MKKFSMQEASSRKFRRHIMGNDFELLLVKDKGTYWEVTGTTYSNALLANPTLVTVRASFLAV